MKTMIGLAIFLASVNFCAVSRADFAPSAETTAELAALGDGASLPAVIDEGELDSPPMFLLAQAAQPASSGGGDDGKYVTVQSEGIGTTKLEAMNAAWIEAVRSAIGMYLSISTEVLNDEIYENLVAYSRGRVNSYRELSATQSDGVWHVTIEAEIEKDVLVETVAAASSATASVENRTLASISTEAARQKSAAELIQAFGASFKPLDFVVTAVGQPALMDDGSVNLDLHFDFNVEKYNQVYLNDLVKLLEQLSDYKGEISYSVNTIERNILADSIRFNNGKFVTNVKNFHLGSAYYLQNSDLPPQSQEDRGNYFWIAIAKDSSFCHVFKLKRAYENDLTDILKLARGTFNVILQAYNENMLVNTRAVEIHDIESIGYSEIGDAKNIFPLFRVIRGHETEVSGIDKSIKFSDNADFLQQNTEIRVFVTLK
ncbi:MAG: hypothetical protein LBQ79_14515 [Deltaproteobacteria bacterium]|jgi:hypothetical protein|nr:hypothetical protein [Deltaproteobacteria bacterium]